MVSSGADGLCVNSVQHRVPVTFDVNMRSGCFLRSQPLFLCLSFSIYLSLSVCLSLALSVSVLTAISPGEPGLDGTRLCLILDFIEAKDDGSDGDNWSCKTCKAPVKSSLPTNRHPAFYRADALPVDQSTMLKYRTENASYSTDLLISSSPVGLQSLSLTLISICNLCGNVPCVWLTCGSSVLVFDPHQHL